MAEPTQVALNKIWKGVPPSRKRGKMQRPGEVTSVCLETMQIALLYPRLELKK